MADTITLVKRPHGIGEDLNSTKVYISTTGSVVVNGQHVGYVEIFKNVYDAQSAGAKTAFGNITLSQIISAAYGTSEI